MKFWSWEKVGLTNSLENRVVLAVFFLLWVLLSLLLYFYNIRNQYGDTAFAAQILYNLKNSFIQSSTYSTSTLEALKTIWYRSADYVCSQPLIVPNPTRPITFHFYTIAYFLAPFARLVGIDVLIAGLQALIYSSVLLFSYLFARRQGLTILLAILITLLVSQHPLWYLGLFGQFYFNRLFLPLCALVIWLITAKKKNNWFITASVLLALSTNEIYGITLGILLAIYAVFFDKRNRFLLVLAGVCIVTSLIMMDYIQKHYGQFTTQSGFVANLLAGNMLTIVKGLIYQILTYNTGIFITVNFLFLAILNLFRPRHFFLLVVFLLPNILVNIGGAEKNGWATHYHLAYFIPMIWLSIASLQRTKILSEPAKIILLVLLLLLTAVIDPATLAKRAKPFVTSKDLINRLSYEISHARLSLVYQKRLARAIPSGQTISAPEPIAYHYIDHPIFYYPMNIDVVDKVIFLYNERKTGDEKFSSPNYGQQDDKLDSCIIARMKTKGFDFTNPTIVEKWAIVGKTVQRPHD